MRSIFVAVVAVSVLKPPAAEPVRLVIARGRSGDRTAVPALVEALRNADRNVRREAAKALGFLRDERALNALVGALADSDSNVRFYAAYALGEMKDPTSVKPLFKALRDPSWCVRDQAAWALRELGDPKIAASLAAELRDAGADVPHVVWVLRHLPPQSVVGPLAALLHADETETRLRAVRALADVRHDRAAEALIDALRNDRPSVRREAIDALVDLRDPRAEKHLRVLVSKETETSVREAAQKAIRGLSYRADLAAHWSFDDESASIAKDVTQRGSEGRIVGCVPAAGKVRHGLKFEKGGYVELGKPSALPIANRPLTVMAWVRAKAARGVIVARGGAFCGFSLYVKNGTARFGIHRFQEGPAYIAAGMQNIVGSWMHLSGVIHQERIELYVNGDLAATAETSGYIPSDCGQGMEIGWDAGTSPAEITDFFEGTLDEVKIFHAALTASEIAEEWRKRE